MKCFKLEKSIFYNHIFKPYICDDTLEIKKRRGELPLLDNTAWMKRLLSMKRRFVVHVLLKMFVYRNTWIGNDKDVFLARTS